MAPHSHDFAAGAIRVAVDAGVGRLTIDNAERRNALTAAMWRAVPEAVHWLIGPGRARVVVLSGAGDRDFSAGADISEFATVRKDAETARIYEAENSAAFAAIREAPIPVIAAIRGICYGGGFGLVAACDLRISDNTAAFAVPAARLGLAYPADAIQDFLQGLGPQLARKALFTGLPLKPVELQACGFLLEVVEPELLESAASNLAGTIARNAPLSIRAAKLALRAATANDAALLIEAHAIGAMTFESHDYKEGRAAFAEKRKPNFIGS